MESRNVFTDTKEDKKNEGRGSKNDSKRIEAEQKDLSYISLILPQSLGFSRSQRKGFLSHLFHFYFGLESVIYTLTGAAVGVWEGSREEHHINRIDINSSLAALPSAFDEGLSRKPLRDLWRNILMGSIDYRPN